MATAQDSIFTRHLRLVFMCFLAMFPPSEIASSGGPTERAYTVPLMQGAPVKNLEFQPCQARGTFAFRQKGLFLMTLSSHSALGQMKTFV